MQRKKYLAGIIIFLIIFFTFNYSIICIKKKVNTNFESDETTSNLLRTSDNEISIVTPENITYFNPMSGYYPATYGFENDFIGFNPDEWVINENPPTYEIEIVKEKNSHKHVVHLNDNESGGYRMQYYPNLDIELGTIELWVLGADVSDRSLEISSLDNSSITGISLRLHSDGWYYYGEYGDQLISNTTTPEDNQWYHIRLDFRCSGAANYMNLSESSYRICIDGKNLGELSFCEPYFDKLNSFMITTDNISDSEWWVDAIGFSWDPSYNIGDNLNEGLLLSFYNNISLDWMGYSLDRLANKTILGNATLSLPANGIHNIQVFGNDSLGTIYASSLRYFTLDVSMINIMTPENKTYTEPMSGYYPATYGFENDENGNNPDGWTVDESGGDVNIISDLDGHEKVVEIHDMSNSTTCQIENTFADLSNGIIEFWVRLNAINKGVNIYIGDDDGPNNVWIDAVRLFFEPDGWIKYYFGTLHDVMAYNANIWYHIKVEFDCIFQIFDLYIDNELKVDDGGINGNANYMDTFNFNSYTPSDNYCIYFDAVSYSWDTNYNVGDNSIEGLLLSFQTSTTFDWLGYSLDDQTIITIPGNKTIPLPENGGHKIEFYYELPNGTIMKSNARYFTINFIPAEPPPVPFEPNKFNLNIIAFTIGLVFCIAGIILVLIFITKKKSGAPELKERDKLKIPLKGEYKYRVCPYCHNKNRIIYNYCIHCGASIGAFKPNKI